MQRRHTDPNGIEIIARSSLSPWSWVRGLFVRARSEIVDDVPAALEACEICRELSCDQERWNSCERRLHASALVPRS